MLVYDPTGSVGCNLGVIREKTEVIVPLGTANNLNHSPSDSWNSDDNEMDDQRGNEINMVKNKPARPPETNKNRISRTPRDERNNKKIKSKYRVNEEKNGQSEKKQRKTNRKEKEDKTRRKENTEKQELIVKKSIITVTKCTSMSPTKIKIQCVINPCMFLCFFVFFFEPCFYVL